MSNVLSAASNNQDGLIPN